MEGTFDGELEERMDLATDAAAGAVQPVEAGHMTVGTLDEAEKHHMIVGIVAEVGKRRTIAGIAVAAQKHHMAAGIVAVVEVCHTAVDVVVAVVASRTPTGHLVALAEENRTPTDHPSVAPPSLANLVARNPVAARSSAAADMNLVEPVERACRRVVETPHMPCCRRPSHVV